MSLAFEAARNLPLMLAIETAKIAREWEMEPWKSQAFPGLYAPHTYPEVDWQHLREQAGEPDWRPPFPVPGFREGAHPRRAAEVRGACHGDDAEALEHQRPRDRADDGPQDGGEEAGRRPSVRAPERQPGLAPHRGPGSHPGALSTSARSEDRTMSGHLSFRAC